MEQVLYTEINCNQRLLSVKYFFLHPVLVPVEPFEQNCEFLPNTFVDSGEYPAEEAGFDMNGGVSECDDDHDRRASALDSDSEVAAAHLQARRTAAVSGDIAGEWAGLPLARDDPINGRTFDFSSVEVKLKEFHHDASQQGPGQGAAECGLGAADSDASRC